MAGETTYRTQNPPGWLKSHVSQPHFTCLLICIQASVCHFWHSQVKFYTNGTSFSQHNYCLLLLKEVISLLSVNRWKTRCCFLTNSESRRCGLIKARKLVVCILQVYQDSLKQHIKSWMEPLWAHWSWEGMHHWAQCMAPVCSLESTALMALSFLVKLCLRESLLRGIQLCNQVQTGRISILIWFLCIRVFQLWLTCLLLMIWCWMQFSCFTSLKTKSLAEFTATKREEVGTEKIENILILILQWLSIEPPQKQGICMFLFLWLSQALALLMKVSTNVKQAILLLFLHLFSWRVLPLSSHRIMTTLICRWLWCFGMGMPNKGLPMQSLAWESLLSLASPLWVWMELRSSWNPVTWYWKELKTTTNSGSSTIFHQWTQIPLETTLVAVRMVLLQNLRWLLQ